MAAATISIEMQIRRTAWLWVLSAWLWSASCCGVPLDRRGVRWLLRRSMVYRVGGGPWKRVDGLLLMKSFPQVGAEG